MLKVEDRTQRYTGQYLTATASNQFSFLPKNPSTPRGLEPNSVSDCGEVSCDHSIRRGGAPGGARHVKRRAERGEMMAEGDDGTTPVPRPAAAPGSDDAAALADLLALVGKLSESQREALIEALARGEQ